ncbi:MAG: hypothetical protein FD123_3861 [Bacteroidetes bacterium]|nr:MAG: hypothetical protein FD123_3861 [Bacteroidota bacterium]
MKRLYIFLFLLVFVFPLRAQIVINELSSTGHALLADEDGNFEDWIELYNTTANTIDLQGYSLVYYDDKPHVWTFPQIFIKPNGHLLVFASEKDRKSVIDHFEVSVYGNDFWRYWYGSEPDTAWRNMNYNDASWPLGQGSIGYGDGDDLTTIPQTMTVYMRKTFTVPDTSKIPIALLLADFDDGFVAYLNGVEIARQNVGVQGIPPPYGTPAYEEHEAQYYQNGNFSAGFFITKETLNSALLQGNNVFCIQTHNLDPLSSDLTSLAHFITGVSDTSQTYFPLASNLSLHTNFNLSSKGFRLSLTDPAGDTIDTHVFETMGTDHSRGRRLDGSSDWVIFNTPTPNDTNDVAIPYTGYASSPSFTLPAGFYSSAQQAGITAAPGETIRYTLDGSVPVISSPVYSAAVLIDSTRVLRARSFPSSAGMLPGLTSTNTYFINENVTLPVVSVSVNPYDLWDWNNGMYVMGPNADTAFPFYGANFWAGMEKYAHCEFFEGGAQAFELDNGFKIHGNWSKAFPQRSFRVLANDDFGQSFIDYRLFPEKDITKFKAFNIRNAGIDWNTTHFRDGLMNRALRKANCDIMDHRNCILFLNGMYWGVYELREREDENYIEQNMNVDPKKIDLLRFYGEAQSGTNTGFIDMATFIVMNDMSIQANYDSVKNHLLDIPNIVDYFASEIYYSNPDWLGNNIKFWRVNDPPGKWRYISWDMDGGLGLFSSVTDNLLPYVTNTDTTSQYFGNPHSYMMQSLFRNTEFRHFFINRYADLINTTFHVNQLGRLAERIHDDLAPEMQRHFAMWGIPNTNPYGFGSSLNVPMWENEYTILQQFIAARPAYARNYIQQEWLLAQQVDVTLDVYPADAGEIKISTIIPDSFPWTGVYFDGVPVTMTAMAKPGYKFSHWETMPVILTDSSSSITLNIDTSQTFRAVFAVSDYLLSVYPNPFSTSININFQLPEENQVSVKLYDMTGREIAELVNDDAFTPQGPHTYTLDPKQFSLRQGLYFVVMRSDDYMSTAKLIYTNNQQ